MRFLRMITNAGLAGLLGAAYLEMLVLQLNPEISLDLGTLLPLFGILTLFYGVFLTAVYSVLVVGMQLFFERPLSPGWLSVRVLAWLGALTSALAALLMWFNLSGFGASLEAEVGRRMALGSVATALSAIALLTIAVMHDSFGRRGSWFSGTILAVTMLAAITTPVALRGPAREAILGSEPLVFGEMPATVDTPRLVLIALDGASLDYISPAVAEGRLPNLGRIVDTGASMHLVTLRPTQPGPVWTSVATGKYPPKSGVRSAAVHRWSLNSPPIELTPDLCFFRGLVYVGLLSEVPNTTAALRARPIWSILSGQGFGVGVVGWPMTYPAQPVRGYTVSDRLHGGVDLSDVPSDHDLTFPPETFTLARDVLADIRLEEETVVPTGAEAVPLVDTSLPGTPTGRDRMFRCVAEEFEARLGGQFLTVHYQGLDTVGHRFLRYAMPRLFGDVSEDERRRFGGVLDRYYSFIDSEVGAALDSLGPDDLLLVVSGFGMAPVSLGKRLLARALGDPDLSGSHERAPDGFMLAYGSSVESGRLPVGSIVDVAPTVLYFLGSPVARDMDGFARTDMFTRTFTSQHPIALIPTHER